MDPDFDSEEEYNSEVDDKQEEDGSDVEYDDGKMSDEAALNAKESDDDDDEELGEEDEIDLSEIDEDGEDEMSDESEKISQNQN